MLINVREKIFKNWGIVKEVRSGWPSNGLLGEQVLVKPFVCKLISWVSSCSRRQILAWASASSLSQCFVQYFSRCTKQCRKVVHHAFSCRDTVFQACLKMYFIINLAWSFLLRKQTTIESACTWCQWINESVD